MERSPSSATPPPHGGLQRGGGPPGTTLHAPPRGRAGTPLSWPLRRGPSEPPSLQAPPLIARCTPCAGPGRGAAGSFETAYVRETSVTGTPLWQKAIPQSGSGTRAGQEGEVAPGSSCLHVGHPHLIPGAGSLLPGEKGPFGAILPGSDARSPSLLLICSHGKANLIQT